MKKVLIIGADGMLGQYLQDVFGADYEVTAWVKEDCDITNKTAVIDNISALHPDIIINAAAYNAVDAAEEADGYEIAKAVNGKGPEYIALAASSIGASLLHFSTDYVFKGDAETPYTENDQPDPQSNYARSKRMGEEGVLNVEGKHYVARTCRLYGVAGESPESKNSFVNVMLQLAADRDSLDIVDAEVASPTYTLDLARQAKVLLEGDYEPGIYHMTNEGACTWYEFANEIFTVKNIDIQTNPVGPETFPRPAARPAYSELENTKLPKMRHWKEALVDYLENME